MNKGFSLVETLVAVTLFSIVFGSVIWGFSSILKMETKTKKTIYETYKDVNETSKKYYIEKNQ